MSNGIETFFQSLIGREDVFSNIAILQRLPDHVTEEVFRYQWWQEIALVDSFQALHDHLSAVGDEKGIQLLQGIAYQVSEETFRHEKAVLRSDCLDFSRRVPFPEDQTEIDQFWKIFHERR